MFKNENIKFPVLNVSMNDWKEFDTVLELTFDNEFYYSTDDEFFNTYMLGHEYVDCNGNIYLVKGKIAVNKIIDRIFLRRKARIIFERKDKKINIEELSKFVIKQLQKYNIAGEMEESLIKKVKCIKSIEEMIKELWGEI